METIELYDKIEEYIKGRLKGKELEAFETLIVADDSLAEEISLHREIMNATGEKDIQDFRRLMEECYEITNNTEITKAMPIWNRALFWPISIAAIFLIGLVSWNFFMKSHQNTGPGLVKDPSERDTFGTQRPPIETRGGAPGIDPETRTSTEMVDNSTDSGNEKVKNTKKSKDEEKENVQNNYLALALKYYDPYVPLAVRKGEEGEPDSLELAIKQFLAEEYDQALHLLVRLGSIDTIEYIKLKAHIYFKNGRYQEAADEFNKFSGIFSLYRYNAEWNLLQAYLAQGKPKEKETQKLLDKILRDKDHPFHAKAQQLNKQLDSFNK